MSISERKLTLHLCSIKHDCIRTNQSYIVSLRKSQKIKHRLDFNLPGQQPLFYTRNWKYKLSSIFFAAVPTTCYRVYVLFCCMSTSACWNLSSGNQKKFCVICSLLEARRICKSSVIQLALCTCGCHTCESKPLPIENIQNKLPPIHTYTHFPP